MVYLKEPKSHHFYIFVSWSEDIVYKWERGKIIL